MSRDGRTIVALDEDSGSVVIERAAGKSLEVVGEVTNRRGQVQSVAMSADGSVFATGEPGKVVIRDVKTRAVESSLADGLEFGNAPNILTLSADRKRIAGYESAPGILIWNAADGRLAVPPLRPKRWESALAFSPDGTVLASGANDGSIVLWSTATGQPIGSPLSVHRSKIFGLAFSPDGKILASGSEDRTVILWDVKTGAPLGPPLAGHDKWPLGSDSWGLSVAFSPDGRTLASAAKDRNVILWDVATRHPAGNPLKGHTEPPMAVAFSADGQSLLSLGRDNVAVRWASDPLSTLGRRLRSDEEGVSSVAFSPDGRILAAASIDHPVTLWDAESGQPIRSPLRGHDNQVLALAFSADGRRLLSAAKDRAIEWEVGTGKSRSEKLAGTDEALTEIAFSADGNSAAWSDGYSLLFRTGRDGPPLHLPIGLASKGHMVYSLAFSPDGRTLVSGGADGTLALWDVGSRKLLRPAIRAHRMSVHSLAFSPDGRILATAALGTADFDGTVRLWDTQSGQELLPALSGHNNPVRALAFSADGKMLACGALDRIVFWDVDRRQRLGDAVAEDSVFVTSLAFSPDGRWLGSGNFNDGAIIWDLRPEVWLRTGMRRRQSESGRGRIQAADGRGVAYRQTCR